MSLRLWRDLVRYAPGQFVPIVVATLSMAIFTRLATPEAFGTFVLVSALATTVSAPFGQWLMQGVLRFYPGAARDGREAELVQSVSILSLAFAAVVALLVLVLLLVGFGGQDLQLGDLLPAGLLTFFSVAATAPQAAMVAQFASARYSAMNVLSALLKLALPMVLFGVLGPVAALLWGSAAAAILVWAVLTFAQLRRSWRVRVRLGEVYRISRDALGFGMPLAVSEIGVQTLAYSDRYVISLLLGAAAVGLYSSNYSIAEKLLILVQAPLIFAAHPQIVSNWEHGDHADTQRMIRNATRWLLVLGIPLVAFTVVRGEMVSALLLGEAFLPGHVVIPIVATSILIYAASQYGHKSFELSKDTWVITVSLISAAVANIVAVVVLTLRFGYIGGAYATVFGYAAYAGVTYVISRRRGPFRWDIPWRSGLNAAVAALAAAVVWWLVMPERLSSVTSAVGIGLSGLLGLGLYAALLVVLGELPPPQNLSRGILRRWSWNDANVRNSG
ncbi:MAG TPA: lipopolysaccharide biosynthesis protein [Chloroflexota bacterium]